MNFSQLSLIPRILKGVEAVGYTTPTAIQEQAIPVILDGRDVLGLAQTGTGKTAAFALPIMQILSLGNRGGIRSLIIAPTRELAEQITQMFNELGQGANIGVVPVYGGVSKVRQVAAIRRGPDVVVACPGRLLDLIDDRSIDLSRVEILVLDEADNMCDMGFLPDIRRILEYIPTRRQTLFFSATMPQDIRVLSKSILSDPVNIQVDEIAPAKTVSHALYPVPFKLKKQLLLAMLQRIATGRVLIFTKTKHRTRRLALDLKNQKYRVAALQGNMAQNQRQIALDGFRSGKFDLLVATDIAARGIDVSEISHVINFDMPNTVDAYTHRIGRTGRAEHTGEALTLTTSEDEGLVRAIEKVLGGRIERRRLPDFDYGAPDTTTPNQDTRSNGAHNTQGRQSRVQAGTAAGPRRRPPQRRRRQSPAAG
ncbi:MAG: DEAD/DEAH box helicase [Chloroflexi bacterium]|nr:DEAD/DEAH box helicase [Chloroflexota bacterium]